MVLVKAKCCESQCCNLQTHPVLLRWMRLLNRRFLGCLAFFFLGSYNRIECWSDKKGYTRLEKRSYWSVFNRATSLLVSLFSGLLECCWASLLVSLIVPRWGTDASQDSREPLGPLLSTIPVQFCIYSHGCTLKKNTPAKMDDIFTQCREGNAVAVRLWLDNTENDLNQGWAKVYLFMYFLVSGI